MKKLTCHCGKIKIQINISNEKNNDYYRCNCSMWKRKGTITTIVNKRDLKIIEGKDKIKFYQFNTNVAKHYFCSICGIGTHNLRRSDPNTYGINVGCLEDVSHEKLFKLNVRVNNGKNHKMDIKK